MAGSDRTGSPRRRVTMADVAREAGVSKATVSLILNDADTRHAQATRHRVRQVADELGYRRDLIASSMRTDRTRTIALLSDRLATTALGWAMVAGAQAAAREHGHMLLVANTEGNPQHEAEAVRALRDRRVDGLIFGALFHRSLRTPELPHDIPIVLLDAFDPAGLLPGVVPDDEGGGHAATSLLLEAGHRRIGFLNVDRAIPARDKRLRGHARALAEHGVELDDDLVVDVAVPVTATSSREAMMQLLDRPHPPTAVFCFNDQVASGAYQAARRRGLAIPEDLSVVGFDNQEVLAEGLDPPLSTIALPHEAMGRWAVEHLMELVSGDAEADEVALRLEPCPPVVRNSVAPPPPDALPDR